MVLVLMLTLGAMPFTSVMAAGGETPPPCAAHALHDDTCGYVAGVEANPCTFAHEHDDACGWDEAAGASPCAVEAAHEHDGECGYAEAVEAQPCTHSCELCAEPIMAALGMGSLSLSDANLLKVAGHSITQGGGTGTDIDPITAAITVAHAQAVIAASDIVVSDGATATLYTDSGFSAQGSVTLLDGANDLYIKVVSSDASATLYHHVTATRVTGTVPEITTSSLPNGMAGVPYYIGIQHTAGNFGLTWDMTGTLPSGLSFNTSTNPVHISGTPAETGSFTMAITVEHTTNGKSAPAELTLTVEEYTMETVGFAGGEWLVTDKSTAGQMTLLQRTHDASENTAFGGNHNYSGSNLQTAMDNRAAALSANESTVVIPRDFTGGETYPSPGDGVAGTAVNGALFWPLSVNEASSLGSANPYFLPYGVNWWLRSPGIHDVNAAVVYNDGSVNSTGNNVPSANGIRPVFYVNLNSVIFTSAAAGGKSGAASAALVAAQPPANFYKFTMENAGIAPSFALGNITNNGGTLTVAYSGAAFVGGETRTISAIVTNSVGDVTFYGKLKTIAGAGDESGTVTVNLPAGFNPANDTLSLYVEQHNGDNFTDFACSPQEVDTTETTYTLTVSGGTGGGSFAAGTQVQITANTAPSGQVFDKWTGGDDSIFASGSRTEASTTITMPAGNVTVMATYKDEYTNRTLVDQATGVSVTGMMTSSAALTVQNQSLHAANTCAACDEIRAKQAAGELILLYDIRVTGYTGELELSIPVGNEYNGQTVTILHCNNGVLEKMDVTVSGGAAKGMFSSFSPFGVMRTGSGGANQPSTGSPQTGDNSNLALWLTLALVSLCGIFVIALYRKKIISR